MQHPHPNATGMLSSNPVCHSWYANAGGVTGEKTTLKHFQTFFQIPATFLFRPRNTQSQTHIIFLICVVP